MIEQLKTIRAGLETATCYSMLGVDAHSVQIALTALTQIEAMVGSQVPVAWGMQHTDGAILDVISPEEHAREEGGYVVPLYRAAPVAQQPQARPDFTNEWTGYLKDGETPFERFLRERKDLNALTKLYQRVLEENERLKAQQPQAEPDIHEAQGQIEFLDKKNNALSAAIRKVMARLADLLDEDQFKEIEEIVSFAGVQPQAEAVPDAIHATLTTGPAPWTNTRVPQAAFDVARAVFGTTSAQDDAKVYQVLQAALHQIAAPQQAEAVPPNHVLAEAERYRWLRDKSVPPHNFYISVPDEFHGVRYQPHEVDAYIDAAIAAAKKEAGHE